MDTMSQYIQELSNEEREIRMPENLIIDIKTEKY